MLTRPVYTLVVLSALPAFPGAAPDALATATGPTARDRADDIAPDAGPTARTRADDIAPDAGPTARTRANALAPDAGPTARNRANDLVHDAGPAARLRIDGEGHLELGSSLMLSLAHRSPDDLVDRLMARYPDQLPAPVNLTPRTRSLQLGPVQVIHRTWSHDGLPIEGLWLTLHVDVLGRIVVISSHGLGHTAPLPQPSRPLSREEAEARAYRLAAAILDISPQRVAAERGLEVTPSGVRTIWRVGVDPNPPGRPVELRLGLDGALLAAIPRATTAMPDASPSATPTGTAYQESPLDGRTVEVPLDHLENATNLDGEFATVYNLQFSAIGFPLYVQNAEPTSNEGGVPQFDYPPIEEYTSDGPTAETQSDTFAEVMMYHHVNQAHDFFNGLGYFNDNPSNGIDRSMRATVNYRAFSTGYFDNAYYSPPANSGDQGEIVFGQGEATDFTYDSSVIYHEYTHAVVDGTSGYLNYCVNDIYGSDCTQGGLNEGTADYFSATLRGDPAIAAYSIGEWVPEYARNLTDANRCPDDLYGEEHEDGKIWGGGLWDVRTAIAGADTKSANAVIDPIILAAISTPLSGDESDTSAFAQAAAILQTDARAAATAGTLSSSQLTAIDNALSKRGLLDCGRFVPLSPGVSKYGAFSTATALQSAAPSGLQYVVQVPEDATGFTFTIGQLSSASIYIRKDRPVEFSSSGAVTADLTAASLSATFNSSNAKFEPGHSYYVAFTTKQTLATAFYGTYYTVGASLIHDNGDGHSFDDGSDSSGCGCTQLEPRRPGGLGATLLGLLAFTLFRRRR
jgi:hypothetical protein